MFASLLLLSLTFSSISADLLDLSALKKALKLDANCPEEQKSDTSEDETTDDPNVPTTTNAYQVQLIE